MYRLLCYGSYALVAWTLLAGTIALGVANAAWARRETWVTWGDGAGRVRFVVGEDGLSAEVPRK